HLPPPPMFRFGSSAASWKIAAGHSAVATSACRLMTCKNISGEPGGCANRRETNTVEPVPIPDFLSPHLTPTPSEDKPTSRPLCGVFRVARDRPRSLRPDRPAHQGAYNRNRGMLTPISLPAGRAEPLR